MIHCGRMMIPACKPLYFCTRLRSDMGHNPLPPWTPHGQVSLYVHDSLLNCLLWGLHNAGALKHSLQVASDLLATLMPAAAKARLHCNTHSIFTL